MTSIFKFKFSSAERLLLPVLILALILNYHSYRFYEDDYAAATSVAHGSDEREIYESVQKENYFYDIYKLSKSGVNPNKILFLKTVTSDNPDNVTEIEVQVNYYFFPFRILQTTPSLMPTIKLDGYDIVISDSELPAEFAQIYSLTSTSRSPQTLVRVNKHYEERFIIYRIEK